MNIFLILFDDYLCVIIVDDVLQNHTNSKFWLIGIGIRSSLKLDNFFRIKHFQLKISSKILLVLYIQKKNKITIIKFYFSFINSKVEE